MHRNVIAAAVAWSLLSCGATAALAEPSPGSIAGRVVDEVNASPVAGIQVSVDFIDDEGYLVPAGATVTGEDGRYRVEGLTPRAYKVSFSDPRDVAWPFAAETYDDVDDFFGGRDVVVPAGGSVEGVDAALSISGALEGLVVAAATGEPIGGAPVWVEHDGALRTARSGTDGQWRAVGLRPGTYRVGFVPEAAYALPDSLDGAYLGQWWRGWQRRTEADVLTVEPGQVRSGVDAALVLSGTLAGTVLDDATGRPIDDCVAVRAVADDGRIYPPSRFDGFADTSGQWRITALPAGAYRVRFSLCSAVQVDDGRTGRVPWWVGGTGEMLEARRVLVTAGETIDGLDARLVEGAEIRGRVVDGDGVPLPGACVSAVDDGGHVVAATATTPAFEDDGSGPQGGRFRLAGLAAGRYRVRFSDDCGYDVSGAAPTTRPSYVARWSTGAATGAATFEEAEPFTVQGTDVVDGVDGVLAEIGGLLSVTATDAADTGGFTSLCYTVRTPGQPPQSPPRMLYAAYVDGLPPGPAVVEVTDCQLDSATSFAPVTATVTVTAGTDVSAAVQVNDRVARLDGQSRIETAALVARRSHPGPAGAVVVARADAYPDALAGAPLAALVDGPLLLTDRAGLHPAVRAEVERLQPTTAYLLGSEVALGAQVADDLRAAGVRDVVRIGGVDRFDTARLIAQRVGGDQVIVVEGGHADPARGWPDAVSASAFAAASRMPVLLVERARLPAATREALQAVARATVVGGSAAVSQDVVDAIAAEGVEVQRVSGATRYATSAAVAQHAAAAGLLMATPWLATGRNWPDALAAGPAAAAAGAALLLVDGQNAAGSPETIALLDSDQLQGAVLLGSREVLAPNVEMAVRDRLRAPAFPVVFPEH